MLKIDRYTLERLAADLHRQCEDVAREAEERMLDARVPIPTPEDLIRQLGRRP